MVQDRASNNTPRQAILLDLSLFILDLLDANKIKENASVRDRILEVPSALVQMLRDSKVGSPILFLFIYALLVKTINKYRTKQITDPRIARLVNSSDYEVRWESWRITQRFFEEFSSLIDIAPKATLLDDINKPEYKYESDDSEYPIRRYDFIGSFSYEEQLQLQQIYTRELNLPVHPLYDQYFSQVFYAESVGAANVSSPRRMCVSLGEETFKIISDWKSKRELHEKLDGNIIQYSRNLLKWFTLTCIKDEWKGLVFDETLELAVTGVMTGTIGSFGLSLVTLTGGTILKAIINAPPTVLPAEFKPVIFISVLLVMIVCIIILFKPVWFLKPLPTPTVALPLNTPSNLLHQDVAQTSTATSVALVTVVAPLEIATTATATFAPATSNISNSPNYCLYLVQPNDILQSVASWFYISEADIRSSDARVSQGVFVVNQLVRISAPCCTHIGIENGGSYLVQPKDNVFRLAINFSTSVDKIVAANNLSDSRYIQAGQMLCIPYP
ncbi:MAG: LysM peptidoglycan-binding domain-containing protein [Chloroflexota bacterium]|nr:LysM peptidoglycan-binding domain-containing protein [Chloroflexota bacterium]MBI5703555.1 LysM peptidoglycan-binding domain-containing protein [Chloroflexota bacterium]